MRAVESCEKSYYLVEGNHRARLIEEEEPSRLGTLVDGPNALHVYRAKKIVRITGDSTQKYRVHGALWPAIPPDDSIDSAPISYLRVRNFDLHDA